MDNINFSFAYNIKSKLDKKGTAIIYIRAAKGGKRTFFSTGISIKPEFWNNNKLEIRNVHPQYISLNKEINEIKSKLIDLSQKIYDKNKYITLDLLKEYFTDTNKFNNSFLDFYDYEINHATHAPATLTTQKTTLRELKEFRKEILFEQLNFELMSDFEKHLSKKGLHQNTIHKYFRHIKKFVHLAIKKDRLDANRDPFIKFKVSQVDTHREALNTDDFIKILQFSLPKGKEYLQPIFDIFLFALYTGLRFSDAVQLPKEALKHNLTEGYYIDLEMIKTRNHKNRVFIPIDSVFAALNIDVPQCNEPMNILKRNLKPENEYLFKTLSNQHINRQLKEIAELMNIQTNTTFHTARHSIAMYLLNECELDIFAIGQLLGHKKIETTQIYSKMSKKGLQNHLKIVANNRKSSKEQFRQAI